MRAAGIELDVLHAGAFPQVEAVALGVTSGAVSQQIRLLEDRVGVRLFVRGHQRMTLTASGTRVYPDLVAAFDQIERAMHTLEANRTRPAVTISTVRTRPASGSRRRTA